MFQLTQEQQNTIVQLNSECDYGSFTELKQFKMLAKINNGSEYIPHTFLVGVKVLYEFSSKHGDKTQAIKTFCTLCKNKEFGVYPRSLGHFSRHLNKKHNILAWRWDLRDKLVQYNEVRVKN